MQAPDPASPSSGNVIPGTGTMPVPEIPREVAGNGSSIAPGSSNARSHSRASNARRVKSGLSESQHWDVGRRLWEAREDLLTLSVLIANAYPVTCKQVQAPVRALRRIDILLSKVRSDMENAAFADLGKEGGAHLHMYYPGACHPDLPHCKKHYEKRESARSGSRSSRSQAHSQVAAAGDGVGGDGVVSASVDALVADLFDHEAATLTIERPFIEMLGKDHLAALILSQVIHWSDGATDPEGWFCKTYQEWEEELRVSRAQVNRAMKVLEPFGVVRKVRPVSDRRCGSPTAHYRLDYAVFEARLREFASSASSRGGGL